MNYLYALLTIALSLHHPNPTWEKQQDHINGRIARNTLDKMKLTTETLAGFLQDSALSIEQYSPVWHGEYFPEKSGIAALTRYGLSCNFYDADGRSRADLLIMANDLSPMLTTTTVNGHQLLSLKPGASKNDVPYFEYTPAGSPEPQRLKFWLIAADNDHLPYSVISRKEYLQEAITQLAAEKDELISQIKAQTPIRSAAAQEAEKNSAISEINNTYSGTDREVRLRVFLKNYCSDEDFLKNAIQKHTAGINNTLHLMDSLLHRPNTELAKPAVVAGDPAGFHGFEDGNADASLLARLNPRFINPALGTEKPRFFLVCWRYNPEEPASVQLDQQFTQQLDIIRLKDFLMR